VSTERYDAAGREPPLGLKKMADLRENHLISNENPELEIRGTGVALDTGRYRETGEWKNIGRMWALGPMQPNTGEQDHES